uniref:putative nuclease HARBI1 n=1 Tax=Scatophagus argus TaxID=75038 RepID=UPI001ED82083|nr:putative nuclease HARBI1 [Scatophagus argus]
MFSLLWPGSTHDARMLSESGLRQLFEGHYVPANCHLLGDSGYPCKPWLLTPYLQPHQGPQLNYNRAHKRTRAVVERGIGQMKRLFHVLHGEVWLTPDKVCKVIVACAILHNICKARQIAEPLEGDGDEESDGGGGGEENIDFLQGNLAQSGLPYRAQIYISGMVLEQQVQQAGMVFERQQRAGWTLSDGRPPLD